ncbi:MAG TPA: GNAT family N-acetyltransferase [Candidatus Sulfotelmatobacter sp.]|jgi:phosphinothricin acetyltransferase
MSADVWPVVRQIYGEGIAAGNATFETELPDWEKWNASHRKDCRLVAVQEPAGKSDTPVVFGWAALSPVSNRLVYAGVAEVSVYVAAKARECGVGRSLLSALVSESEAKGVWTLQAGIFPENLASITLHERCGFRVVGRRQRIGNLDGVWKDVLLLERRSEKAGT